MLFLKRKMRFYTMVGYKILISLEVKAVLSVSQIVGCTDGIQFVLFRTNEFEFMDQKWQKTARVNN